MKTVALIADIHANLAALLSVLAAARQHGAYEVWDAGDALGYGPEPDGVVTALRACGAVSILGNYDQKALNMVEGRVQPSKDPLKTWAFRWSVEELSATNRTYLQSLPDQRRFDIDGWHVLLVHGSPESNTEHLTPETPDDRLEYLAEQCGANIIISGHSHRPFARMIASGTFFINPGSVGRPEDGDPRPSFAVLRIDRNQVDVTHLRPEYMVSESLAAAQQKGLPPAFLYMLEHGVNYKTARKALEPGPDPIQP